MDQSTIRAWWWRKQGLDGSLSGSPAADILQRTGWARSVAGVGPYLTLFSRGRHRRAEVDKAVADVQIHELPSARGCTYVVPAADYALALRIAAQFGDAEMNTARKLGVTDKEIDKLSLAVLAALTSSPLDPDDIKKAVGSAARNLGPDGVKKGITTTLPLALGTLQTSGELRRIPVNGRLDQQRYKYALWNPNPLDGFKLSLDECYSELARRYFQWTGPASLAAFQWFSGLGVGAAKKAIAPLELVEIAGSDGRLLFLADRQELLSFRAPKGSQIHLLSSLDSLLLLRRDMPGVTDANDLANPLFHDVKGGFLKDLPSHGIFDRGRLIGLWEFDVEAKAIAYMTFAPAPKDLLQAVKKTEAYIAEDLGDARSFSLDSPKSRIPKVQALRAAAAH